MRLRRLIVLAALLGVGALPGETFADLIYTFDGGVYGTGRIQLDFDLPEIDRTTGFDFAEVHSATVISTDPTTGVRTGTTYLLLEDQGFSSATGAKLDTGVVTFVDPASASMGGYNHGFYVYIQPAAGASYYVEQFGARTFNGPNYGDFVLAIPEPPPLALWTVGSLASAGAAWIRRGTKRCRRRRQPWP